MELSKHHIGPIFAKPISERICTNICGDAHDCSDPAIKTTFAIALSSFTVPSRNLIGCTTRQLILSYAGSVGIVDAANPVEWASGIALVRALYAPRSTGSVGRNVPPRNDPKRRHTREINDAWICHRFCGHVMLGLGE